MHMLTHTCPIDTTNDLPLIPLSCCFELLVQNLNNQSQNLLLLVLNQCHH